MTKFSGSFTLQAQMQNASAGTWSRVPGAPTIGTATVTSSTSASVAFTPPADLGFGTVTYIAVSSPGGIVGTSATSPITISGLTSGVSYTFTVDASTPGGVGPASAASNSITPPAIGQQEFTTPGTFSWVAPAGVTSVSVVAVGGGGGGNHWAFVCAGNFYHSGGSGGGLGYKNNVTVIPGTSYTVVVGAGGIKNANQNISVQNYPSAAGDSYFINTGTVRGGAGAFPTSSTGGIAGGTFTGDGGGNGGASGNTGTFSVRQGGGGGAGGYSGNGGTGGSQSCCSFPNGNTAGNAGSNGSGGGGGGGGSGTRFSSSGIQRGSCGGGGVGLLGQGASGTGGSGAIGTGCVGCLPYTGRAGPGTGGSGGASATAQGGYTGGGGTSGGNGGAYGGGGGSALGANQCTSGGSGGGGAVRIIWPGTTRSFPSTNTGNL